MKLGAIILAAGLSSRMGRFKPLLALQGRPLLAHCSELFRQAELEQILVVVGHRAEETIALASRLALDHVYNPAFEQGMFSSICCGVQALQANLQGFFLLPVDIPLVRPDTLDRLQTTFTRHPGQAAIPIFAGQPGHPPLLPAGLIPAILAHDGTGGLQTLLERQPVNRVEVWDQGILYDADTPDDIDNLARRIERMGIPTREETQQLARLLVPEQGWPHGRLVALLACALGRALQERGHRLNQDLLFAGGWLHDLAKGQADHGRRAAALLASLGLPAVAAVVAEHGDLPPPSDHRLDERHLVCLADKAARGGDLIAPKERYRAKLEQFGHCPQAHQAISRKMTHGLALQHLFEQQSGKALLPFLGAALQ